MLREIRKTLATTVWVQAKGLKMNIMSYLMLVIVYPISYLVISIVSGTGEQNIYYVTGIFTSIFISLFINMEAVQIANQNSVEMAEIYAVYNVSRMHVFWGQCVYHMLLLLPILILDVVVLLCLGAKLCLLYFIIYIVISFFLMSLLAIAIGSLIKNPQIASALINMLYMIIVMITPIYNDVNEMTEGSKLLYSINPFTHMCSLYYWALGLDTIVSPFVSLIYIVVLCMILYFYVDKSWKNRGTIEKLTVW